MVFQPVIPSSGLLGLTVLDRTFDRQLKAFSDSAQIQRNIDYFRENAGKATTPEEFVADRRLMEVALGAFGLSSEIDKKALIRKMLEEGTSDRTALANRFADPRYRDFVAAVGFIEDAGSNLVIAERREDFISDYKLLAFEEAVGAVDGDIRLALNFRREIAKVAEGDASDDTKWLKALGQLPVRSVLDTAFGLPPQFVQIDIDRQVEVYKERARSILGTESPDVFRDPAKIEEVVRRFIALKEAQSGPSALTPGVGALSLLQSSALGASAQISLILSNAR